MDQVRINCSVLETVKTGRYQLIRDLDPVTYLVFTTSAGVTATAETAPAVQPHKKDHQNTSTVQNIKSRRHSVAGQSSVNMK